jgi:hypothetical protein
LPPWKPAMPMEAKDMPDDQLQLAVETFHEYKDELSKRIKQRTDRLKALRPGDTKRRETLEAQIAQLESAKEKAKDDAYDYEFELDALNGQLRWFARPDEPAEAEPPPFPPLPDASPPEDHPDIEIKPIRVPGR